MFNRYLQIGVVALSLALLAALFATTKPDGDMPPASVRDNGNNQAAETTTPKDNPLVAAATNASRARAVLAVQGMTCSGCIAQIKSSLSVLDGIGDVIVDLANGRVEVTYDIEKIKETGADRLRDHCRRLSGDPEASPDRQGNR